MKDEMKINSIGLDITDRTDLIGICYTMWFNAIHGNGTDELKDVLNVSELLQTHEFSSKYGFVKDGKQNNALTQFHYWAEPAQGYYRSTDAKACRNNMMLLQNAGVDFLILDYTYATAGAYSPGTGGWRTYIDGPMNTLLNTITGMRAEGLKTPYVVMWINDKTLLGDIYNAYYNVEKWKDCFVYWNNKPFAMLWQNKGLVEDEHFTLRGMYGLQGHVSKGQWSYLEVDNTKTICYDETGKPEHVCACVATQQTYMTEKSAHGRDGGAFWHSHWLTAFDVHPKILSITWWNEWCAQLYNVGTEENPYYIFTDNFNREFSRDIEPVKGGHGDLYYKWLCEYVRCYKEGKPCPNLVEEGH